MPKKNKLPINAIFDVLKIDCGRIVCYANVFATGQNGNLLIGNTFYLGAHIQQLKDLREN